MDPLLSEILEVKKLIQEQILLQKEVLNLTEACQYLELSQSHLYKLTSSGSIPVYKPNGKKLYFKRTELEGWLLRNRTKSKKEIENGVVQSMVRKRRRI